ncbi:MAG: chorismate-binding protein, partial [Candidatus Omnitrophica bacterium]|nr:chorismate-binding protein [Candidatus Omnitrophota bacterium]
MVYYRYKSYRFIEPNIIFRLLKDKPFVFFLDSSLKRNSSGRYSFLGAEPFFIFKSKSKEPFSELRRHFNKFRNPLRLPFPFWGGLVGYLTYDLGFSLEKKVVPQKEPYLDIPECFFGFYNWVFIFDHFKKKFYIFCLGFPEKTYSLSKSLCESNFKKLRQILEKLNFKPPQNNSGLSEIPDLASDFTKETYIRAIKRAKDYIRRGEIYQVNLSQRFEAKINLDGFFLYQNL